MPKLKKTKNKGEQVSSGAKLKAHKPKLKVIYPEIEVRLYHQDPKVVKAFSGEEVSNPLTAAIAKELVGWIVEGSEGVECDKEGCITHNGIKVWPTLNNLDGKRVWLLNNLTNRPFYENLANDWKLEILRKKWQFNGESGIIDEYGMVQDFQHRLVGLIQAVEEWEADGKLPKTKQQWQSYWFTEPVIDTLVTLGIEASDAVVNTIGTGKRRSLEDALYRYEWIADKPPKVREQLARVCSFAVKVVWRRSRQDLRSEAPRRPHSESFEFIERHPMLLQCVKFINDEASDKKPLIPLGTAAGLLYLMGSSTSDLADYNGTEKKLDWKLYDKAEEFFVDFFNKGKNTEQLAEAMLAIPAEASGPYVMDLKLGMMIKAWHLYAEGKKITKDNVELEQDVNEIGQPVLAEHPRCGGIDVEVAEPVKEPPKPKTKADKEIEEGLKKGTAGKPLVDGGGTECLKGGSHEPVTDPVDGAVYCGKCLDPM